MPSQSIVRLGLLLAAALGALQAQDLAGYVLSIEGTGAWSATPASPTRPGAEQLAAGAPVYVGSRIDCQGCKDKDKDKDKLTVASLDGLAPTYSPGSIVPALHDTVKSEIRRLVSAVAQSLSQQKRALVFGISRGSLEVTPAVLELTGHRVNMVPAMGRLDAGEYQLEFTPVDGGAAVTAKCNFDPPSSTAATATLSPRAYTLSIASASGTPIGNATVLIVSAADYDTRAAEFHQGVEFTTSWVAGSQPQARNTFLSALLVAMASAPDSAR